MIKKITDDNIDNILQDSKTFIILFYSEQLSTISNVMNVFENFDAKFNGKIDIYKCAIDEETGKLSQYFNMSVLPAVVMMKNNIPYVNLAGPVSASVYEEAIKDGIINIMKDKKNTNTFISTSGYQTISK